LSSSSSPLATPPQTKAKLLASAAMPPGATHANATPAHAARPNLLWIMADDLGVGEPSYTDPGKLHTPHLDELARGGMRFTAAYAGYTVCAPSRATLFSGRHSGRLAGAPADWPLLPRLLQQAGYETRAFGKSAPMDAVVSPHTASTLVWGLPTDFGFDGFDGQPSQLYCHNMYPTHWTTANRSVALPLNAQPKSRERCMATPSAFNYTTDLFADAAIAWLQRRAATQSSPAAANAYASSPPLPATTRRPFFAYVSFTVPHAGGWGSAPHAPEQGQPVPTDLGYAKQTSWPPVERDHAASVTYLDKRVGDLLAALRAAGEETTTAVFFASDNGAHNEGGHKVSFFDSTGGLRGFKRSFYEGGIRSPSLVRWPAVTPAGSVSHVPWAFWDVLPTLLEMAGVPPPRNATLDGRSIVAALRGESMAPPPYLYWTWRGAVEGDDAPPVDGTQPAGRAAGSPPGYAVRVDDMKGVVHACADKARLQPSMRDVMELYNLTADPHETKDVAATPAGAVHVAAIKRLLVRQQPPISCECYQC